MRLMGLDVGSKTVGISVSDPLGWTAQAVEIIPIDEEEEVFGIDRVAELVQEKQVGGFVVGLPKNMNNTEGPRVEASHHYGELLKQRFPDIPVDFQDERLTTVEAHRMLVEEADISRAKQKKVIDEVAATFILQSYLDRHGKLVQLLKWGIQMSKQAQSDDQLITLIDEDGNEQLFKELFTFDSDDYGKSYIFIYPADQENDDSVDIQAYIVADNQDGGGQDLVPIEDDQEWDMVEQVLNTFLDNDGHFQG